MQIRMAAIRFLWPALAPNIDGAVAHITSQKMASYDSYQQRTNAMIAEMQDYMRAAQRDTTQRDIADALKQIAGDVRAMSVRP